MRVGHVKALLAVVLCALVPVTATWAAPADGSAADTAAIKTLFNNFNDAFNKHDAKACATQFTDDADFINIQAVTTKGKAEVEEHLAPLFADRLKAAHREVTMRDIRFVRPDVATIDSDYVMSGLPGPNGTSLPPNKGLYDWIVTKQNGKWLIAVWHESNLPPAAPPAAPAK